MSAVEKLSRFQQLQKPSKNQLSAIVVEEGDRLKLASTSEPPAVLPTSDEIDKIADHLKKDFTGLQFTANVNLADSKKAFKTLKNGLDDDQDFMSLFGLHPHEPYSYSSPTHLFDPSVLMEAVKGEKNTSQ